MSKSIDYNCDKTWDLFKEGKTKGVFQLESNLGRSWSKKVSPSNMEELSALISFFSRYNASVGKEVAPTIDFAKLSLYAK